MRVVSKVSALRTHIAKWRTKGYRIALVPTLGNLHRGHLALVDRAMELADRTVVSIYVNPTQFVAGEDFETYPRTLGDDIYKLSGKGVELVFTPDTDEVYPSGTDARTQVAVPALDGMLCGEDRPGHFTGVATVVSKLFNMVQPDLAVFGEKDYQQLMVIKCLVMDLLFPVEIVDVPTLREVDGLALSSRNSYLSVSQRKTAPRLYEVLKMAALAASKQRANFSTIETSSTTILESNGFNPEYVSIRHTDDLSPADESHAELVVLAAAWLGKTRLIDNVPVRRAALK